MAIANTPQSLFSFFKISCSSLSSSLLSVTSVRSKGVLQLAIVVEQTFPDEKPVIASFPTTVADIVETDREDSTNFLFFDLTGVGVENVKIHSTSNLPYSKSKEEHRQPLTQQDMVPP